MNKGPTRRERLQKWECCKDDVYDAINRLEKLVKWGELQCGSDFEELREVTNNLRDIFGKNL